MSETELQSAILAALKQDGAGLFARNNVGGRRGGRRRYGQGTGSADIVGLVAPHGRYVALEVKAAKGEQSDDQRAWQAEVERRGGYYAVVRSVQEARAAVIAARSALAAEAC
jgi:hypothetical protein